MGSMVPMGDGNSGLAKLRRGWLGRTHAVGMLLEPVPWASSAGAGAGAPGTGLTAATCSVGGAEELGRRGAACWAGGGCWSRRLVDGSDRAAEGGERGGGGEDFQLVTNPSPDGQRAPPNVRPLGSFL